MRGTSALALLNSSNTCRPASLTISESDLLIHDSRQPPVLLRRRKEWVAETTKPWPSQPGRRRSRRSSSADRQRRAAGWFRELSATLRRPSSTPRPRPRRERDRRDDSPSRKPHRARSPADAP